MAAIDDLIAQIDDPALRERLAHEVAELQRTRKFGLVFEQHLPELLPIYSATPRPGDLVGKRGAALTETWLVLKVEGEQVHGVQRDAKKAEVLPLGDVVVVRQFGDPIFPALVPMDKVQNGPSDAPWHTLIEADNYHALQLLEYLYVGQVDCIYIDPPYNTGARDWKYNNDYVDANDGWRHSKWLAMMEKRLKLARRLLKKNGVLIITIDDYEFHHLRCMAQDLFNDRNHFTIVIEHNKRGRQGEEFAKSHEYALVVVPEANDAIAEQPVEGILGGGTRNLRRTGNNSLRSDRQGQFYPIVVDRTTLEIVEVGSPPGAGKKQWQPSNKNLVAIWPLDKEGVERNWHYGPGRTIRELAAGKIFSQRQNYGIQIYYTLREKNSKRWKTVWSHPRYDASTHGTELLSSILGGPSRFSFPKSVYAVKDCLSTSVVNKPTALIVDFFAGSGTTLDAVNLLNIADGGRRRCILVTNNEVSGDEAEQLAQDGNRPGDEPWEGKGICRNVTWPRAKFTILGKRDDGTRLSGHYFTGQMREVEKARQFIHIGFLDAAALVSPAKKKQIVALIDELPQSLVGKDCDFIVSEEHGVSILFDETKGDTWLAALDGQDHVERFIIVAPTKKRFEELRSAVHLILGPTAVSEEVRRPLQEGFPANIEYFRLDFLDKDQVALKRRFREILPLLWMRAGCVGARPTIPAKKPEPAFLLPEQSNFAVLLDEMRFPEFSKLLAKRRDVTHVFLVTDSHEAFEEMAAKVKAPTVIQLYRDYLENFLINRGDVQ